MKLLWSSTVITLLLPWSNPSLCTCNAPSSLHLSPSASSVIFKDSVRYNTSAHQSHFSFWFLTWSTLSNSCLLSVFSSPEPFLAHTVLPSFPAKKVFIFPPSQPITYHLFFRTPQSNSRLGLCFLCRCSDLNPNWKLPSVCNLKIAPKKSQTFLDREDELLQLQAEIEV